MTVILVPKSGADIQINQWNWKPTVQLLMEPLGFDQERAVKLTLNSIGERVTIEEAKSIASFLSVYLIGKPMEGRVSIEGDVLVGEKDRSLDYDGYSHRNYAAEITWLWKFKDFCSTSEGFDIV